MALGKLGSYITLVSGPFHPFGGAIDIVVVQQPDGTFKSSPWYVRFGKFQGVLKSREKIVNISVNGEEVGFCMYLDHKGEAFFLHDADSDAEGEGSGLAFAISPVSSGDEREDKMEKIEKNQLHEGQTFKMQGNESCQVNRDQNMEITEKLDKDKNDQLNTDQIVEKDGMEGSENNKVKDGQIVKRTGSRRAAILQLMFGRRSSKDKSTAGVDRANSLERAEMAADLMEMKWSTNLSMRDRSGHESNSENFGVQDENSVTGEPMNVTVAEEELKIQSNEAGSPRLDLHDNTLADGEEVDVMVVELGSGNVGHQEETLVKPDETVDTRVMEEGIKVQPTEAGNGDLDWHESLLAESEEAGYRVVESDSSNLEGQGEILARNGESANLRVVEEVIELQLTEASSAGLDLHQSAVAEEGEVKLSMVESDSCTLGVQNENWGKTTESVSARAMGQAGEVPSSEAGSADLDLHDSLATVSADTDEVGGLGSVHVPSSSHGTKCEVYVRDIDPDSSNSSGEDQNFDGASLKEMVNGVPQRVIIKEIAGVSNADLDLHERSLTATEENAHVFSDCVDAISVHVRKEGAVENGTREINQVVAIDSLELYKQECCDSSGKKNVLQGHLSEVNPRLVTVNSDFTDILESYSSTILIETSSDHTLNKVMEVSSGDDLPETMDLASNEQQQNENFLVQKLEITDLPVESSNSELSSHTAVFDKCGDSINQYLLSEGSICKTQRSVSLLTNELESTSFLALPNSNGFKDENSIYGVSVPENSEELQFDFSDDERGADSENKIEITNVATVTTNENETPENEIEEADASDSENRFETNPISIPGTNSTRNESMAMSLPNIQFDKIEQIERLSCSLETGEVKKEKDSFSTVLKGDSQSSSNPSQIKSETGLFHDGTVLDAPDEKSATFSPLIGELLFLLPIVFDVSQVAFLYWNFIIIMRLLLFFISVYSL